MSIIYGAICFLGFTVGLWVICKVAQAVRFLPREDDDY